MKRNLSSSKEIECKWQAHSINDYQLFLQSAKNQGVKLSKPKNVQIKDLYLDTPEKFFQISHLECRIRLSHGHSELTLKSFSDPHQKIFIRDEKTVPLPDFTTTKAALTYCRKKFFKNIQPLFELLNNRRIHTLHLPCGTCAEASFDQVLMCRGKKKFRMNEIELEFKSGDLKNFKEFVSQLSNLSLNPSKASKFNMAMAHLLGDSTFCLMDQLNDLADQILKINIQRIKENEAGARKTLNPEAIHDIRVATRRLRAAIKTFNRILPAKAEKIRAKLQRLFHALGKKRDLDVFSEFILLTVKAKTISFPKLTQQINKSQKQIRSMFKSNYYARMIGSLEQLKTKTTRENIFKVSIKKIQKALWKVLEIAPSIDSKVDDVTLHKLRISAKKLRYICEFFEPIFSKYICSLGPFIEKTRKIQDILGEHQDAIMGISMLSHYESQFSSEELQQIKKNYELKKLKARRSFFKIWRDFWFGIGFRHSSPANAIELIMG